MKKRIIAPAVALASIVMAMVSCSPISSSESSATTGSSESVSESTSDSTTPVADQPVATGAHQYVNASYAERKKILSKLEKYLIDNNMSGLPLYSDSGYQLFNPRVVKGTQKYVKGYGFSTLRDGKINGTLPGEKNSKYQGYYHTWNSTDPQKLNAWNDSGSVVSSLLSYCSSSLFGTKLNSTKDGYEWYGVLAKDDHMSPVGEDGNVITKDPNAEELHTTWRVHVRTGESGGVKYHTNSTKTDRSKYDGTYVQLEDYLTPFKMLLNGANGYYRGKELAEKTGKSAIAGASTYYSLTKGGSKGVLADTDNLKFSDTVGVSVGTDADGDYLQITYGVPVNRFYAMYQISDSLYEPLPAAFVNEVGTDNLFVNNSDKSYTIVDNSICLGPYSLESWEEDKLITFKKNSDWYECVEDPNLYQIEGIHMAILTGYTTNKNIAFEQFINSDTLDAVGVPTDYLKVYSKDPRAVAIPGDSSWKLNINSCTKEYWEELFGENGSVTTTKKEDYWDVKPWMSNDNFIRGMYYSIDRETYAKEMGGTATINFFGDAYVSNPETGEVYNDTEEHAAALEDFWGDTVNTNGYSLALSEKCFEEAIKELIASGDIKTDTTEISIKIFWMYENQIEDEGALIGGYIKMAFDAAAANLGYPVRLKVEQEEGGAEWDDVYYSHLLVGQFDLAFGSISGNALDPLNYLEIFKPSSGFCLCWGKDTSEVRDDEYALSYDNMRWSYDGLWGAADSGIVLDKDGHETAPVVVTVSSVKATADTISIAGRIEVKDYDGLNIDLLCINCTSNGKYSDYFEISPDGTWWGYEDGVSNIVWDTDNSFSFTLTDTVAANLIAAKGFYQFAVDYDISIDGVYGGTKSAYTSVAVTAATTPATSETPAE